MKFLDLGLPEALSLVLKKSGIDTPTPVQDKAIPLAIQGKDLIASAKTGSGKTLAFSLPMLMRLIEDPKANALVMVPTRELADQVLKVLQPFLKALKFSEPCLLIGGVSFVPQVSALRRKPRVIVATPGRLLDHINNGQLRLDQSKILILDEADRMLDMGFLPQVRSVMRSLPAVRQTLLFTATLPDEIKKITKEFMKDPQQVFVDPPSTTNADIDQQNVELNQDQKNNKLLDVLNEAKESVLVFTRTKRRADRVGHFLKEYGVHADVIHGDRSQGQRTRAIDGFRSGRVKVLVATDIAARGIDIPQVELVVNYDLPEQREDYVHRIGRTGRAGAKGVALSFVTPEERSHWEYIEGKRKTSPTGPVRSGQQQQQHAQRRSLRGKAPTQHGRRNPHAGGSGGGAAARATGGGGGRAGGGSRSGSGAGGSSKASGERRGGSPGARSGGPKRSGGWGQSAPKKRN